MLSVSVSSSTSSKTSEARGGDASSSASASDTRPMLTGDSDPSLGGPAGLTKSSKDDKGAPVASRATAVSASAGNSSGREVKGARGDDVGDGIYEGRFGEGGPARILPPEFLLVNGGLAMFDPLKERVRKVDGAGSNGGEGAVM